MKKTFILIPVLIFLTCCGNRNGGKIEAPGIVDGNIITIKSQVAGIVEQSEIQEGDTVEKGTVLAKVNSDKAENQLKDVEIALREIAVNKEKMIKKSALIKENLKYLNRQVKRFQRLGKSRSLAGEKVENMELKLLEAETSAYDLKKSIESLDIQKERAGNKKEYLELVLNDHHIKAPAAGVIVEKFVSAGENVFPNSSIVDILDISGIYVEVFIEEREISSLKLNQAAQIFVDGLEDKEISGVISYFGKKAEFSPKYIVSEKERKSLLYRVKVRVEKGVDFLKVGMPVTIVFVSPGNS
jgi:HlyD family secretion protein